jgi:hypothetical protein
MLNHESYGSHLPLNLLAQNPGDTQLWTNDESGLKINATCLKQGNCAMDLYKTLNIRAGNPDNKADTFVKDVFLWATFFIGTMATIGIIYAWLTMVLAWSNESKMQQWVTWLKYSMIGLLLVLASYSFIRLVEYIATGEEVAQGLMTFPYII